ncbi:MAG: DUF3348 domain-containing protein [Pseudomonadales bacterium]|nr:DUF3348 domain-containing protein [Pseudomonadales bacterium]
MNQASFISKAAPPASLNSSRLIRFLTDLAVTEVEVSHERFAERIGRLIDFSESIILSGAHGELDNLAFEKTTDSVADINELFLSSRVSMVQFIVDSCRLENSKTRIKFPALDIGGAQDPDGVFDPVVAYDAYYRFYLLQQRDMDTKIQHLRIQIRDFATGRSPRLAQLAVLDTALGDTLHVHTRRFFSIIPKLMEKRFNYLVTEQEHNDPKSWSESNGWVAQFCHELRGLLLAELDIRLQPLLGLVEAFNEEVKVN